MKTLLSLALATLVLVGGLANAQNAGPFTNGAEVHASAFTLPATAPGTMIVKACAECATNSFQITARTEFRVNGQAVPLSVFRAGVAAKPSALLAFQTAGDGREVLVIVAGRDLLAP
jgi:hypothetical protein